MPIVSPLPMSERIGEAVKAALLLIVSDGVRYSYTPDVVLIVEDLNVDKLETKKQLVYWILEGDHKPVEATNNQFQYTTYLSVFGAYRYPAPPAGAPARKTIRNLIAEDIIRALTKDVSLGGLVINVEVTEISRDIRIDNTVEWICVSAFVVVTSKAYLL